MWRKKGKLETALFMLQEGLDLSLIQKVTGLTRKEILNEEKHLNKSEIIIIN